MIVYNSLLRGTCNYTNGTLTAADGNVEGHGDTCDFDSATNRVNATDSELALGSLGLHGGHTPTFLPAADSIAVDAGIDHPMVCLDTDQRGYTRPFGAGCDAGAVEVSDVIFADGFE